MSDISADWPAIADDDGTGTTGTVLNQALFNLIKTAINNQVYSPTNPALTPAAIIDEVKTARGNLGSLSARLAGVVDADGNPIAAAGLLTAAQFKAALGSRNVIRNGDLSAWAAGAAAAPDDFTLTGAGATIARTGIGEADTFHFGTDSGYAAKVTRAGTNWKLTQDVIAGADFAKFVQVKGQKFSVAVKGKTSIASHLRLVVDDGATQTVGTVANGGEHTGGGSEEHLSLVHPISSSATKLQVYVEGLNSNGDSHVGGFVGVFSDLAPSDWPPFSVGGFLTAAAQTILGRKTFATLPLGIVAFSRSAADFTKNNNSTLSDVTGLSFAVEANRTYFFIFVIHYRTSSTADLKVTLTGPAAPTAVRFGLLGITAGGVQSTTAFGNATVADGIGAAPSVDQMGIVAGILRNGANAGTVQLQAAQNTNEVADTIVRAESAVIALLAA